jgi:hypothetical protein
LDLHSLVRDALDLRAMQREQGPHRRRSGLRNIKPREISGDIEGRHAFTVAGL